MSKIEKIGTEQYVNELKNYYRNRQIELAIIGLNDSQGVNNNMLQYIANLLSGVNIDITTIDAFSLLLNKAEHIDYFLKYNLSVKEIKLSQIYSAVASFRKVMHDIGLPEFLGNIAYLYSLIYKIEEKDKSIRITDTLQRSQEPILIYSSGANNLMREVANNPFSIKKDYKNRNETPNFYYTVDKCNDPVVLQGVIDSIKRNFDTILGINDKTDIFALGIFVPKALQIAEMNIFRELIIRYNEALGSLCKEYAVDYVDTEFIGREYSKSSIDFHGSPEGYKVLADYILLILYEKKQMSTFKGNTCLDDKSLISTTFNPISNGIEGIITDIESTYQKLMLESVNLIGYDKYVANRIIAEHKREVDVLKRVLKRK